MVQPISTTYTTVINFRGGATVILNKAFYCIATFFGCHSIYYIISETGTVTLGSPLYRHFFPPLPPADISRDLFPEHNYTYHFHSQEHGKVCFQQKGDLKAIKILKLKLVSNCMMALNHQG